MSIKSCTVCEKTATKICGWCKEERYCSVECQTTAWKTHKAACLEKIRVREGKKELNTLAQATSSKLLPVTIHGIRVKLEVDQSLISRLAASRSAADIFELDVRDIAEDVVKSIRSEGRNTVKIPTGFEK